MSGPCATCGGGYPVAGGYYCPLCDGGSENVDLDPWPSTPAGDPEAGLSEKQRTRRAARRRRKERRRLAAEARGALVVSQRTFETTVSALLTETDCTLVALTTPGASPERRIMCHNASCPKEAGADCDVCFLPICEDHGEVWTELLNPSGAVEAYVVSTRHTDSLRALLARGASGKIKIVCAGRQECRLPLPRVRLPSE